MPIYYGQEFTITFPEGYEKVKLPGLTRWVEALRSGDYKQGTGRLKFLTEDSQIGCQYCCLGVLCEVEGIPSAPPCVATRAYVDGDYRSALLWQYGPLWKTETGDLPDGTRQSSVLGSEGKLPKGVEVNRSKMDIGACYSLVCINDTGLFTFSDIADILEQVYYDGDDL